MNWTVSLHWHRCWSTELEESVATFLPWSPTTVVLLESDWLDCDVLWANIAEAANNDTRMSLFMQLITAIRWPTAKLKQMRTFDGTIRP